MLYLYQVYTGGKSLSHFVIIIVWSNSGLVLFYMVFDIIYKLDLGSVFVQNKCPAIKINLPDDFVREQNPRRSKIVIYNNIFHNFELKVITNTGSTADDDEDYGGEYKDGLERSQAMLLENV